MGNLSEVFSENVGNYQQINENSISALSRMVDELIVEIRQGLPKWAVKFLARRQQ